MTAKIIDFAQKKKERDEKNKILSDAELQEMMPGILQFILTQPENVHITVNGVEMNIKETDEST